MNGQIHIFVGCSSETSIYEHLLTCDASFVPPLSERIKICDYAHKVADRAERFEAWSNNALIGLVAAYFNDSQSRTAYITSVSVVPIWQGRGIASQLLSRCVGHARDLGFLRIELEVSNKNVAAVSLYEKHGFVMDRPNGESMILTLEF